MALHSPLLPHRPPLWPPSVMQVWCAQSTGPALLRGSVAVYDGASKGVLGFVTGESIDKVRITVLELVLDIVLGMALGMALVTPSCRE